MYKVGSNNTSTTQEQYLLKVKAAIEEDDLIELRSIIETVALDVDIRSGREELLPDWGPIVENYKAVWEQQSPRDYRDAISQMLLALQQPGHNLKSLDPHTLSITFLLGAGASKPAPSNIPTVKELLTHLLDRAQRLDRVDLSRVELFCRQNKITNIEDLLTAAELATFCSRSPNVLSLMNHLIYRSSASERADWHPSRSPTVARQPPDLSSISFLQDTLQVLFGLLSNMMLPAKPNEAHKSIANYATKKKDCSIVTTNYDCCIDLALVSSRSPFNYSIKFLNSPQTSNALSSNGGTRLIKLHGSLNWYYCDTCQEIHVRDAQRIVDGFLTGDTPYPVISICRACGSPQRALLVPPLAMKFDAAAPLAPLLQMARTAFHTSDVILAVGYSFAQADVYISRLISKSLQTNPDQKLIIFDIDSKIIERVRRRFKAIIPNFDEKRIVDVVGDCSILVPKFLNGCYYEANPISLSSSSAKRTEHSRRVLSEVRGNRSAASKSKSQKAKRSARR